MAEAAVTARMSHTTARVAYTRSGSRLKCGLSRCDVLDNVGFAALWGLFEGADGPPLVGSPAFGEPRSSLNAIGHLHKQASLVD